MGLLLSLVGLGLAIVMVVAQCQLFVIRRLLEQIAAQRNHEQGADAGVSLRPREKNIGLVVGVIVTLLAVGMLAWVRSSLR